MLKKIRQVTALLFFVLLTLLFLDFTGTLHNWFGWLVQIQLFPAILAGSAVIIIAIVLLTFLFGRIYCSVICPLGVMQDFITRFANRWKKKAKRRFCFKPAKTWSRYTFLTLFVLCFLLGINAVVSILDPFSAYGRIVSQIVAPLYIWGNNLLAYIAERGFYYAYYYAYYYSVRESWFQSVESHWFEVVSFYVLVVAILTLIVVGIFAWRNGRSYCNTVCPVGTALGFISRFSIFRPAITNDKCTGCHRCDFKCKASCIDSKNIYIDHSRCVTCFNCLNSCKHGAVKYTFRRTSNVKPQPVVVEKDVDNEIKKPNKNAVSRRNVLTIIGVVAASGMAAKAQRVLLNDGLTNSENGETPQRATPIVPPGAQSLRNFTRRCTACQLCVTSCPNRVLRPSVSFSRFMQPEMLFERGWCRPECVECSSVCPSGAIRRITPEEKSVISIGLAHWRREYCRPIAEGRGCRACERICPTGGITMIQREGDSLLTPDIDLSLCIGCGACENRCPVHPIKAIYVEGREEHTSIV